MLVKVYSETDGIIWLRIPCPLSQSRPSLPANRVFILNFPPFHQRSRSERFERMVPEELLPQLILQIGNRKWLLCDSSRLFLRNVGGRIPSVRGVLEREEVKEGVQARPGTMLVLVLSILP